MSATTAVLERARTVADRAAGNPRRRWNLASFRSGVYLYLTPDERDSLHATLADQLGPLTRAIDRARTRDERTDLIQRHDDLLAVLGKLRANAGMEERT